MSATPTLSFTAHDETAAMFRQYSGKGGILSNNVLQSNYQLSDGWFDNKKSNTGMMRVCIDVDKEVR